MHTLRIWSRDRRDLTALPNPWPRRHTYEACRSSVPRSECPPACARRGSRRSLHNPQLSEGPPLHPGSGPPFLSCYSFKDAYPQRTHAASPESITLSPITAFGSLYPSLSTKDVRAKRLALVTGGNAMGPRRRSG